MKDYRSLLSLVETEIAIKFVKDAFERELAKALDLTRVSAPLFVLPETGLNDNLNGYERTVKFEIKAVGKEAEIVQSLAKWKRAALKKYGFREGKGLYTDMNAIRRDEDVDYIHSVYVDQWDWERILKREDRTLEYLNETVRKIYGVFKTTARLVAEKYPDLTRKEREDKIVREKKAVFLIGIGWDLADGKPHDGRAADYDDWNLNGDILLYNELYDKAFEVSSMGIRVDEKSLRGQLEKRGETEKLKNPFCRGIVSGELPLTIGGGIGQSRICMYFLKKAHIGEVQSSIWTEKEYAACAAAGIELL